MSVAGFIQHTVFTYHQVSSQHAHNYCQSCSSTPLLRIHNSCNDLASCLVAARAAATSPPAAAGRRPGTAAPVRRRRAAAAAAPQQLPIRRRLSRLHPLLELYPVGLPPCHSFPPLAYARLYSRPLSEGPLGLPFQRPDPRCRTFHSDAIEQVIQDVTSRMKDPDLARLFENAFPVSRIGLLPGDQVAGGLTMRL
jgi:hypothetical protein